MIFNIFKFLKSGSYQKKRSQTANWNMMKKYLVNTSNLLDLGCDVGEYCFNAEKIKLMSIGIDGNLKNIENAERQKKLINSNAIFIRQDLNLDFIKKLPKFENIICLSVYHHFVRKFGEFKSEEMIKEILEKTEKNFFFQISSKDNKYKNKLNFRFDQSVSKTDMYINKIFKGFKNISIFNLGKKIENPPIENFRILYLIKKN